MTLSQKLFIGTPCYGGMLTVPYFHSILQFQNMAAQKDLFYNIHTLDKESLVTRARNRIVAKFLNMKEFTHLLFIDADIGFDAKTVFRLLESGKEVVSAVYPKKNINWEAVKNRAMKNPSSLDQAGLEYPVTFRDHTHILAERGFAEVKDSPTGFMMIKRVVFEKMIEAYPELEYKNYKLEKNGIEQTETQYAFFECMIDPSDRRYLSEDYTFCRRWQNLGGKIFADLESPLAHYGSYAFKGSLHSRLTEL